MLTRYEGKAGQWWNAPPEQIRHAYYRLLREVYGMPAWEAWQRMNENFAKYPQFFNAPLPTLRAAVTGYPLPFA